MIWLYDEFKATGPLNASMVSGPSRRYFFSIWRQHQGANKEIIFPLRLEARDHAARLSQRDELLAKYGPPGP